MGKLAMKQQSPMPRRAFISGLASSACVLLAGCSQTEPPTYGNVLRMGDLLTYKAHRLLLPAHSLAREYDYADISSVPAIGTTNPADPAKSRFSTEHGPVYERLLATRFADWRLVVEGSVTRPRAFSLDELKRMSSRTDHAAHVRGGLVGDSAVDRSALANSSRGCRCSLDCSIRAVLLL